jgi:hypothetical protein
MLHERKDYKILRMAPYSANRNAHVYVVLSYPPDASREFLKELVAIVTAFETGVRPVDPAPEFHAVTGLTL